MRSKFILGLVLALCMVTGALALDAMGRGVTGSLNIEGLAPGTIHEVKMDRATCYVIKNKLAYPVGTLAILSCVR